MIMSQLYNGTYIPRSASVVRPLLNTSLSKTVKKVFTMNRKHVLSFDFFIQKFKACMTKANALPL